MRGLSYIIIYSLLGLSACNYHLNKTPTTPTSDKQSFADQTPIDAQLVQQAVLNTCTRCHSGANRPDINSVDAIKTSIAKILVEVNANEMPPPSAGYAPLSDCQKAILQAWSNAGMPDSSNQLVSSLPACAQGAPPQVPAPAPNNNQALNILNMPLNYQTLNTEILQVRCLHCHNANSGDVDASGILLFPYSELVAHKNLLGINSAKSKFYHLVSRTDDSRMPPPEDGDALTAEQIEFVKRWIDAGHPEN